MSGGRVGFVDHLVKLKATVRSHMEPPREVASDRFHRTPGYRTGIVERSGHSISVGRVDTSSSRREETRRF